jgi:hypothetical protein
MTSKIARLKGESLVLAFLLVVFATPGFSLRRDGRYPKSLIIIEIAKYCLLLIYLLNDHYAPAESRSYIDLTEDD